MNKAFPDYPIQDKGPVSGSFLRNGVSHLQGAIQYMRQLPYGRNTDKEHLLSVFEDGRGTCSTKHALLKRLAVENEIPGVRLIICLFRMNANNTPKVGKVLERYGLEYIPEAHCYLEIQKEAVDCTGPSVSVDMLKPDILSTIEIEPHQITDYKVAYHQAFLAEWLKTNPDIPYRPEKIFSIREECIMALSQ